MGLIVRFFVERPILVNFLLALNFIMGGFFLYKVPKEAFPGVSLNQIIITVKYPGASAKDVELNVSAKIEEKLSEIGNIKEFWSTSVEGVSRVDVTADDSINSADFKSLLDDIQTEIDKIDDFPEDIEGQPIITSVTTEDRPILEIAFAGDYDILKKVIPGIEKDLRKISGVSKISVVGLPDEEIHIEVNATKAKERDVDLNSIYRAINNRNLVGTGGTLESFVSQKKIVSFNKYENPEDVLNTIVRMSEEGYGVYLKEVAEIHFRPKEDKLIVRNNGERGASLLVAIRGGEDQLKISDKIKKYLNTLNLPQGSSIKLNNDISDKARSKFSLLKNNGFIGFVLVVGLLFFFLGGKVAFWTAFGIPFSVFGSMILFVPLGMSLNSVSMGAFVIVLGMIVDDAMVISERFVKNLESGMPPEIAASQSVSELWKPVLASSLTTVIAFLPLLALGGLPGKFIWQMPIVVSIALFVSLFDCYFLLPAHLAHSKRKSVVLKENNVMSFLEIQYEKILNKMLNFKYMTLAAFLLVLVFSVFIGAKKLNKDSFPQEASEGFSISLTLEKGLSLKRVEDYVKMVESHISGIHKNELEGYTARLGTHSLSSLTNYGTEENLVTFLIYLTPYSDRSRTANEIVDSLKEKLGDGLKANNIRAEFELMRVGPPLGKPFEVIVSSNDDEVRAHYVEKVKNYLSQVEGVSDVEDDVVVGKNEINLKLDYKKVAQAGLTPSDIIRTLRIAFDGQVVTEFTSANNSYDFRLRLSEETRKDFNFITKLPLANSKGYLIKLDDMVRYDERPSFAEIKRYNGERATSVSGNIDVHKMTAIEVLGLLKKKFQSSEEVRYIFSGRPVEESKIFGDLKLAAIFAIVGIYFILSLMFNSYIRPLMIIVVIPFCVVGVFLSFYFHGLSMSMFAGVGLIGLAGIVVNDSIVLIDHLRKRIGEESFSKEILIQACKERLRPITLTTISTVVAVIPTAYSIGGYDNLLSPLSLAILYGLLFGTLVVLLFVPTLYFIGSTFKR